MKEKRSSFSNSIGFVLAAAGSAVGLGNIWRFPYLAAKDGGGLFLVVYVVLALTFGFTLLVTEVAIGRKTHQSCLTAYGKIHPKFRWIGGFSTLVPFLILPYYCIIGGWVLKYAVTFLSAQGRSAAQDGYFTGFITSSVSPIVFDIIFLTATALVVYMGVDKGIEKVSRILMPILFVLVIVIAVFSITVKNPDTGVTGLDGLKVYLIPSLEGIGLKEFSVVVIDAMGQLFYSISVAMGIMVTFGSYVNDDDNLMKSVNRIEIFDTMVAILAGVMIIPAVVVFMGTEGMDKGPGLMFVALPKVFEAMGGIGQVVGSIFFVMVLFAALTSSVSVLEAVVAGLIDRFHWSRRRATVIEYVLALGIGIIICLGYNVFYFEQKMPNGGTGQILDVVDYLANNIFMPIVAIGTCIMIGWVVKPKVVIDEVTKNGEKFGRKNLYKVMVTVIAPILLTVLLLGSLGIF
ncbi:MAG: sodium-dependent transporter [Lachnospiraceae bacterium]|nr:sodium-dependent transporter [Lachnospiraceae bacterium]